MQKIGIINGAQTKFGEHWDKSLAQLIQEAGQETLKNAGINKNQIQKIFIGNMAGGRFVGQDHIGALAAEVLGINAPSIRCEGACASSAIAFRQAYISLLSGKLDCVLVLGVEKMTDVSGEVAASALMGAGDSEWESSIGLTFSGLYALMAKRHMHDYGTTREQLAQVSVTNHEHGKNNQLAQFPAQITIEDVLNSAPVAEPLQLLDCSPITDGAAGLVLATEKFIQNNNIENPVWVLGSGQASDTLGLHNRDSITEMLAVKKATESALSESGITRNNIDILEVHDCFSINEILCLESLGFVEKGQGGKFIETEIQLSGSLPTNTTGGLKSIGHPVGATGVRQLLDITKQLQGCSINQLSAKIGLALNIGGSGATAVVNILGVE
jgi:acetyl-CoA C-acetyltransferase